MKALEQWEPDADEIHMQGLDLNSGGANGWSASEMFKMNATKFQVESTFKDNLEGYTV